MDTRLLLDLNLQAEFCLTLVKAVRQLEPSLIAYVSYAYAAKSTFPKLLLKCSGISNFLPPYYAPSNFTPERGTGSALKFSPSWLAAGLAKRCTHTFRFCTRERAEFYFSFYRLLKGI